MNMLNLVCRYAVFSLIIFLTISCKENGGKDISRIEFITYKRALHYYNCDSPRIELYDITYLCLDSGLIVCKVRNEDTSWYFSQEYSSGHLSFHNNDSICYEGHVYSKSELHEAPILEIPKGSEHDSSVIHYRKLYGNDQPKSLLLSTVTSSKTALYRKTDVLSGRYLKILEKMHFPEYKSIDLLKRKVNERIEKIRVELDQYTYMPCITFSPCQWLKEDDKYELVTIANVRKFKDTQSTYSIIYNKIATLPQMDTLITTFSRYNITMIRRDRADISNNTVCVQVGLSPKEHEDLFMPLYTFYVILPGMKISCQNNISDNALPLEEWKLGTKYNPFDIVVISQ